MSAKAAGRSSRRQGHRASDRVNAMVEEKLDAGLEYEALQLFRGQSARKAARGDIDAAVLTAKNGIDSLMKRGFVDSASELGFQIINILKENNCDITNERIDMIKDINQHYLNVQEGKYEFKGKGSDAGISQAGRLQSKFLKAAISWTAQVGRRQDGDASLNTLLGKCLFSLGNIDGGASRLVAGESPMDLVTQIEASDLPEPNSDTAIRQYATDDEIKEIVFSLAILRFLSLGNLRDANVALKLWTERHHNIDNTGMIKFCRLLCKTCEYDAALMFKKLVNATRFPRDPSVEKHLAQIGKVYFNIAPPPSMLDGILNMLGMNG